MTKCHERSTYALEWREIRNNVTDDGRSSMCDPRIFILPAKYLIDRKTQPRIDEICTKYGNGTTEGPNTLACCVTHTNVSVKETHLDVGNEFQVARYFSTDIGVEQ